MMVQTKKVIVAKIGKTHGVKGALKLYPQAQNSQQLLHYQEWFMRFPGKAWEPLSGFTIEPFAQAFLIRFKDIHDCNTAQRYVNAELAVPRESLAPIENKNSNELEVYWTDLEGLVVVNLEGIYLGHVDHVMATGANDVLVVKWDIERLIPFVKQVIKKVDLAKGEVLVEWGEDW